MSWPERAAAGARCIRRVGALLAWAVLATPAVAAPAADPPPGVATEIAAGVYVVRGAAGEVAPDNRGRTGNAGFVVGTSGVVAIDSGTSYRQGQALLAAIGQASPLPLRRLVLTQARQEFIFGAGAFRERGVPVLMHRDAARLMAARCDRCLATLRRTLGDDEMQGTALPTPDLTFTGSIDVAVDAEAGGRRLRVLDFGLASGPGAVAVFDERSGVLFAGGLLDHRRIPDVQDADLDGWLRALDALRRLPITAIVPGHGPVAGPALIDAVERYLRQLQARVRDLFESGAALAEVPELAVLPEFETWDQADVVHRRNASIVFLRLEREQLTK
ncbi:MBL fold metallo-hydrolase [Azohydromonas sediminis]|uniref:MBL fold metallo-hydrolase n=1 Tax=Azohydromonas sediminis TaxID=2259674 RepID=UPI000E6596CF|nr:MBL fold metallo-hydrolase [Azohydromonas sediminis]